MDHFKIGFDQQEITPTSPKQMGGYAGERISEGVHDPLYVRTLVLENQQDKALTIFASYDLLQIDTYLRDEILKEFDDKTTLVLFATHTHSGPDGTLTSGRNFSKEADFEYLHFLKNKTIEAINQSVLNLETFEYRVKSNRLVDVYSNRHDPTMYYNDKLTVLKITTPTREALIYNFACHPTILKSENKLFSKDLLWGIEENLNSDFSMFINSTAGDVSTRFNRESSDFQQILKTGKIIADKIKEESYENVQKLNQLSVGPFEVTLKTKTPHSKKFLETRIKEVENQLKEERNSQSSGEIRILETEIQGYQIELASLDFLDRMKEMTLNLNLITWDQWTMVTIPGELFSVLAKKCIDKGRSVLFSTYTDGSNGYITDKSGYDLNYYESTSSLFEKGEGEKMMEEIEKKLGGSVNAT